jgi:glycosyltransferase involved in cell wall biosynthesis
MPAVTVIIPTYNRQAFVVKAVNSVLNQTSKDFEIIVVDDGSTDATRAVLEPYLNQIKYVYQTNAGVSAARNAGIALATGEWIAFLDSDDEWAPHFLARHMEAIKENNDICMQIADCRYSDQTGEKKSYFEINGTAKSLNGNGYYRPKDPFVFLLRHLAWQVGSAVIRRDTIKKAGLFDVTFNVGEDHDFIARVGLHGPVGFLKDKLLTAYRRSETTENLSKITKANPVASGKLHDGVYYKLETLRGLNRTQRRTARGLRAANYRAIGNDLLAGGSMQKAREAYWTAVKIQPSAKSIGKYLLSFFRHA